jgi:hypothetical protein
MTKRMQSEQLEQAKTKKSHATKVKEPKGTTKDRNQGRENTAKQTESPNKVAQPPADPMPPVPYTITSKPHPSTRERQTITTTLAAPSPEDECPLTLEPIATSGLSFLPDCPFLDHAPFHRKMTLPCGHSFSAVPLLYHMCKNNMTCPCCRSGPDRPADFACIPAHFRDQMTQQILSTVTTERREDERETIGIVVSLRRANTSFVDIANRGELSMTLTFSNPEFDPRDAVFQFSMALAPFMETRDGYERTVFRPRAPHMRMLEQIVGLGTELAAITTVTIPNIGDMDIEGVRTTLPPGATGEHRVLRGSAIHAWARLTSLIGSQNQPPVDEGVSTFEMGFGEEDGSVFLNYLCWRPDMSHINWALRVD